MSIIENTDRFHIDVEVNRVNITDKQNGYEVVLANESARGFLEGYEAMKADYADPESPWHLASWNDCLAQATDAAFAEEDADYAEWRRAAKAQGWHLVDQDPSEVRDFDGPCLYHADQDRVMPIGGWKVAVEDLGFTSARDALDDANAALSM